MIPLPYMLLGGLLSVLLALGGGYFAGRKDGRALEAGEHRKVEAALAEAQAKLSQTVADSVSKIEVKNVYTTQRLERETVEVPVYRDCHHTPDAYGLLNNALTAPEDRSAAPDDPLPEARPAE